MAFTRMDYPSEVVVSFVRRNYNGVSGKWKIRCLDLGCGWGNNLRFLRSEGFNVYGIDLLEDAVSGLRKEFGKNVICGNMNKLPFPGEYFDFCLDRSSIQHNSREDIHQIHREVYRVLKPGGRFFSMAIKSGYADAPATHLDVQDIGTLFAKYHHYDVDYLRITRNGRTEDFTHYLISAVK